MAMLPDLALALPIGIGATALMDLWLVLLARLGVRTLDFAMLGRWAGHLARGRFFHASIAASPRIAAERTLGWLVHYAIGIAFAALLVAIEGPAWLRAPSAMPALAFGACTVAAPLLVMQPAMGAGLAARRTATPLRNVLRSLVNHLVFGASLYLAARVVAAVAH